MMDNAQRRRMALGFLSNWVSRLAGTLIQLVQVPVFLTHWSAPVYGEWIAINAIPSYLSFSNIGFGSVATNEMTMLMGREDREGALRVFQSCWWLIALICATTILLLAGAVLVVPTRWFGFSMISATDTRWILFALGAAVLFAQLEQLMGAAYACVGRYAYGTFLKSMLTLAAFAAMIVSVLLGHGPRTAAVVFGVSNAMGTVAFWMMVRRDIPWLEFGWNHAQWSEIRRMTPPAFAFMGFPIGNALNLQGTILAVEHALGPTDVVIFATARTVSRVALQMVQLVNQTFWPELSKAFGAGNLALVRTLHRRSVQMAMVVGVGLTLTTLTLGPWFLVHWTAHKVPPSPRLLLMLMISVLFYAGWSTSSTLLAAINRHQTLAAYYLAATAITVAVTYVAAKELGLVAAATSLILSELIMNFYVVPASLRISEDTASGFFAAMFTYPRSLHPLALWKRLRPTKPQANEPAELDM